MGQHDRVVLAHGAGGEMSRRLIEEVFVAAFGNEETTHATDAAVLESVGGMIGFTTDSYVVNPLFFPGGDIGKLAVAGTVNDLAVSGAEPIYLSFSVIIEEGFPIAELADIARSAATTARAAGVHIVTGDTKVVERGACDGLYITTSGVGRLADKHSPIGTAARVGPGDVVIINGTIGDHETTLLVAREEFPLAAPIASDCAPLNGLIAAIKDTSEEIGFMRDATRGGLATVLCELNEMCGYGIELEEAAIPISGEVSGTAAIFGYDPLYMANEGKVVVVVPERDAAATLDAVRAHDLGHDAAIIGRVSDERPGRTVLRTAAGGSRVLGRLSGTQLPRIC